uniref:G_PROTEIN_RECEP_F1_2 domain-containing protein n=1 Tax=Macrostomum lignano TaxID=282301 RepID=A0A1I8H915_9PLAT
MVTRNRPFDNWHAFALVVACATIGAAWSLPPMFGVARVRRVSHVAACDLDWESGRPGDRAYLVSLLVGEFLLPLAVIAASYAAIFMHIRRHRSSGLLAASSSQARRDRKFAIHVLAIIGELRRLPASGSGRPTG